MTALSALLRKTPSGALREYFDRPEIGMPTEFDWTVPEAQLSGPLLNQTGFTGDDLVPILLR